MQALFIAHDHLSSPGLIGAALEDAGFTLTVHEVVSAEHFADPNVPTAFPELSRFDLIVPLGAPWSVYDRSRIGAWVDAEQDYLRGADHAGVPVLGVCFGGQLLASAHGGDVAKTATPEIGWTPVRTDDADVVGTGPWFQWHLDRFTPPPGAREIARNDAGSQAFTLRRNLGLQFHPEVDATTLAGWLGNGGYELALAHGIDPDALIADTVGAEPAAAGRARGLVTGFLDQVASANT